LRSPNVVSTLSRMSLLGTLRDAAKRAWDAATPEERAAVDSLVIAPFRQAVVEVKARADRTREDMEQGVSPDFDSMFDKGE
jgi:hypothetical protein